MIAVNIPLGNRTFDGTDDYVDIGEVSALKVGSGDFSITGWFKISSIPSKDEYILGWGEGGYYVYIDASEETLVLGYYDGSSFPVERTIAYSYWWADDRWHFFALTRDRSTGQTNSYLDGIYIFGQSSSANPVYESGESLAIGRKGSSESNYFTGSLRDIRIYGYELSESEVGDMATTDPTTPPISQWLLDETSGSTAKDNVGSNDGTFYGGSGSALSYHKLRDIPESKDLKIKVGSDWKIPKNVFIKSSTWQKVHSPKDIYTPDNSERGEDYWIGHDIDANRTLTFYSDRMTLYHNWTGANSLHRVALFNRGPSFSARHIIDVTDLTTIYIDWEYLRTYGSSNYCYAKLGLGSSLDTSFLSPNVQENYGFSRKISSLNVSSYSGSYYLIIISSNNRTDYQRTLNIYKIWGV